MRRTVSLLLVSAVLAGACSGSSDGAATTEPSPTLETAPSTEPATTPAATDETTTTSTTTVAPTTTIDEAALLAAAEAAYLESFEVGLESIRDPNNPEMEDRLRTHFTDANLDEALANLHRAIDGNFVAKEAPGNPSFAEIVQPAEFVEGDPGEVLLGACEFNSDKIFEVGTAPGGGDSLRRDEPVSLLFAVRLVNEDGQWKSSVGTKTGEIFGEEEQCSDVS